MPKFPTEVTFVCDTRDCRSIETIRKPLTRLKVATALRNGRILSFSCVTVPQEVQNGSFGFCVCPKKQPAGKFEKLLEPRTSEMLGSIGRDHFFGHIGLETQRVFSPRTTPCASFAAFASIASTAIRARTIPRIRCNRLLDQNMSDLFLTGFGFLASFASSCFAWTCMSVGVTKRSQKQNSNNNCSISHRTASSTSDNSITLSMRM